jgi:hypothetical protein
MSAAIFLAFVNVSVGAIVATAVTR